MCQSHRSWTVKAGTFWPESRQGRDNSGFFFWGGGGGFNGQSLTSSTYIISLRKVSIQETVPIHLLSLSDVPRIRSEPDSE